MEELIANVNWLAVVVGAVAAYALGALWYSQKLFGKKWARGALVSENPQGSMIPAMISQAVGTFLLAWLIGITETTDSLSLAVLVALTIAVLIKANGFFAGKSKYAIAVESGFILAMVFVMIVAQGIF